MIRTWDQSLQPSWRVTDSCPTGANPWVSDYATVATRFGDGLERQKPAASLGEALADVPSELDFPSSVEFRVVVSGRQRELSAGLRDEIYSIGREAIVNAFRHSGAREIEAEVEYRSTGLRIAVRDNGRGIDPEEFQSSGNEPWGLQAMRERAEKIGARLRLLSRIALGTEVELSVPRSW